MLHSVKVKIEIVQRYFCIRKRCELLFKNDSYFPRGICLLNMVNRIVTNGKPRIKNFVEFPYI